MRLGLVIFAALALSLLIFMRSDFSALSLWVVEQQRAFQNQMAVALRALRTGDVGAYLALFAATGAYGFVHALGPGHGKYLVGGVGLGTSVSTVKLTSIAIASSLLQAAWAITLVYGGFALLEVSANSLTYLAEDILAPASYAAIGLVGLLLAWRGARALMKSRQSAGHHHHDHHDHDHHHHHDEDCGHNHGPTPEEVAKVGSFREAAVLIASIAVRPCTGAIFLLVIAWQMDIKFAGAAATIVMGLGTAALTSLVAVSSIAARRLAIVSADASGLASVAFPAAQIFAGMLICWISIGLLMIAL